MGFWSNFTGGFADKKPKPCPSVMDPVDGSVWCESELMLTADGELITPPEAERRRRGQRSTAPVISLAGLDAASGGTLTLTRQPPTVGAMRTALHGPLPGAGQLVRTAGPPPAISAASRGGDGLAARLRDLVPGYGSTDATTTNTDGRAANDEMRRKHLLIIVATALITYLIARRSQ